MASLHTGQFVDERHRTSPPAWGGPGSYPAILIGTAVVAIVAFVSVSWFVVRDHSSSLITAAHATAATAVSQAELQALAVSAGAPIYWAGAQSGFTYEYTRTPSNRIFVRYLPFGTAVGTSASYLTVATYPLANAYSASKTLAGTRGAVDVGLAGGVAFYRTSDPKSVYVAYPGSNYQIEVFDPSAGSALALVQSGRIAQVNSVGTTSTTAASTSATAGSPAHSVPIAEITTLATPTHPIYWVGQSAGMTYELTQTTNGRTYLRYLPRGVKAGATADYLTVGTYPFANAFHVVEGLAKNPGSTIVKTTGNAIAFYYRARPTNIYVAFPGSNFEIEIFDPVSGQAKKLVTSGKLIAVS